MTATWAVVLAGGQSRRFGADKLSATVDGRPLLDRVLVGLPAGLSIVVVGPERPTARPVSFVREHPAGGGPGAGLVAGLSAVVACEADEIVVLPGDAPDSAEGAVRLLAALREQATPWATVAADQVGREQPLQLALSRQAAAAIIRAAGPGRAAGASARRLLAALEPPAVPVPLADSLVRDLDTPEQLAAWESEQAR